MGTHYKKIWLAIITLILLGEIGIFIWRNKDEEKEQVPVAKNEIEVASSTIITELEPSQEAIPNIPLPNLQKPIVVTAKISDTVKKGAIEKINTLTAELLEDNDLYSNWLELAINRKLIGDYDAAEEIWIYITKAWANDSIAYSNLADLYLTIRHDNERAETYLLDAIEKAPNQVILYENAYSFYRYVKKDLAQAKKILEEGIKENPLNAEGLKKLLADLEAAS